MTTAASSADYAPADARNATLVPDVPDVPDGLRGLPDYLVAAILKRRADEAAAEQAVALRGERAADHARRSRNAVSVVFTLRLSHEDFAVPQGRAAERCIAPSALARTLIRRGLGNPESVDPSGRDDDLAALAQRVRSAVRVGRAPGAAVSVASLLSRGDGRGSRSARRRA